MLSLFDFFDNIRHNITRNKTKRAQHMINHIERYFWVFLIIAILLGFSLPSIFSIPSETLEMMEGYVIFILMIIMGILFLKVDILDILTHMKKPLNLLYIVFINLIATPIIIFGLAQYLPIQTETLIGITLLGALPAGVSSAIFTDIFNGRTSLSLTTVILSNLLAVFSIPFILWLMFDTQVPIDHFKLLQNLFIMITIPFIIAKILKRIVLPKVLPYIKDYFNILTVLLVTLMIMLAVANQSHDIMNNFSVLLPTLGLLYLAFITFQLIGYFSVFWQSKGRKLAISNSNMIMNNILGIVLVIANDLPDFVQTIMILSFIPWVTMISAKHWYRRFLP